jgi:hypothetical protein
MRKWATENNRNSYGNSKAWHQTSPTTFFAPCGPAVNHHTYKRLSPARLRSVLIRPLTSRTEFARLLRQPTITSISPAAIYNTSGLLERIEVALQVESLSAPHTHKHSQSRERHRSKSRARRSTPDY